LVSLKDLYPSLEPLIIGYYQVAEELVVAEVRVLLF
jgi:hypothetical protein